MNQLIHSKITEYIFNILFINNNKSSNILTYMKAKKQFELIYDESITIVKKIKLKNDNINKKSGVESQVRLLTQINQDKQFFQHSISKINTNIKKMEENYLDPDSVRKIQTLKKEAKKQISRNQYLIKQLINNSFNKIEEKQVLTEIAKASKQKPREIQQEYKPSPNRPNPHVLQIQQQQDISYYDIQKTINIQKSKMLSQFQHNILQINSMISQTAEMTYKQGEDLDIIGDEISTTYKNTISTKAELQQASIEQKKSRTKYIVIMLLIMLIVGIIASLYAVI